MATFNNIQDFIDFGGKNLLVNNVYGGFTAPEQLAYNSTLPAPLSNNLQSNMLPGFVSAKDFGAKGDGVTDDTVAIQSAINHVQTIGGGTVFLPGSHLISNTLVINDASANGTVTLTGTGFASTETLGGGSSLLWNGSSGLPMLLNQCQAGSRVSNLRFRGNINLINKPLCAIQFDTTPGGANIGNYLDNIWIGYWTGDFNFTGTNQFTKGIYFSGTINGDSNYAANLHISQCDDQAIHVENGNAGITISNLFIQLCGTGIHAVGGAFVKYAFMGDCSVVDILVDGTGGHAGSVTLEEYFSEGGSMCAQIVSQGQLVVRVGSFQINNTIPSNGVFFDALNAISYVNLEHMQFPVENSYSLGFAPTLRWGAQAGSTTCGQLRIVGGNLTHNNINIAPMTPNIGQDSRQIIFRPQQFQGQDPQPVQQLSFDAFHTENLGLEPWRNDFAGRINTYGGPLKVRQLPNQPFACAVTPTGTGATTYGYRVTALTLDGETAAGPEGTCTNASTLNSTTNFNVVSWMPIQGALAYKIYGRTSGSEQLLIKLNWTDLHPGFGTNPYLPGPNGQAVGWKDDGSLTPSGAMPTVNSTGNLYTDGLITCGGYTVANLPLAATYPFARSFVTDATATTFASIVAGSGSNKVPVYSDGTNWIIG